MQIQEAISAIREHQGDNTSTEHGLDTMISRHVLRMGENIVEIFHLETDLHKNIIFHVFSDGFEDNVMNKMRFGPLCCSTLEILTEFLDYQGCLGGEHLVSGLNKTIRVGEMIEKRCRILLSRYADTNNRVIAERCTERLVHHAIVALRIFFQVGDRKHSGDLYRFFSKYVDITIFGLPRDVDVSSSTADDELWRLHKKVVDHPLACINCGTYEESGGDVAQKHNKCSRCHNALYCSKECQLEHWKQHKKICKEISKEKKASRRRKCPKYKKTSKPSPTFFRSIISVGS